MKAIVIKRQKEAILSDDQIEIIRLGLKKVGKKMSEEIINWSSSDMLEVYDKTTRRLFKSQRNFNKNRCRQSRKDKTLYQSCHILHKQGKYYITHFKELFALDGKKSTLVENDIQRRNEITLLFKTGI